MSLPQARRRQVHERAGGCCEYCRLPSADATAAFHVDHFIPIKHGGTDEVDNLCLACFDCNMYKSHDLTGFDPDTGEITALFNPRQYVWAEHFVLQENMQIQGLSAQGRTTISVLRLNLNERVENRLALAELGVYPCRKS